jgi:hypothetical protein
MAENPALKEIADALVQEVRSPERDVAGIAAFLDSIVLTEDGSTLLDRLVPIARSPQRLAKIPVKLLDERLIDPAV